MDNTVEVPATIRRGVLEAMKDWMFLSIESKEVLFVLLSFFDAKLTSLCLKMGGYELVPWMKGWGANVALRMAVATAIMLYIKMRGRTPLLWFGILVLFAVVIWNCFMLIYLAFDNFQFFVFSP